MKRADTEILTVDDLAELFACDKETAAARLTSGDLPGVKVGRGWIVPRQALFERLNEKAREEASARRAQHVPPADISKQQGKRADTPTAIPHSINTIKSRGRKRRIPPALPPMTT